MKYNLLQFKDVFFKKVIKYYILEFILFIVYLLTSIMNEDYTTLFFGLNKISFVNPISSLIKIIDIAIIFYSTYNFYFYDLYRNPEFNILRETNKKYISKKLSIIILYNVMIKLVGFILIMIIFKQINNIDMMLVVSGIFNIILTILIAISIINLISDNNYIMLILLIGIIIYNLFFKQSYLILDIIIAVFLYFLNIYKYSTQKIYNKFIKI